jgi:hypothetical protein
MRISCRVDVARTAKEADDSGIAGIELAKIAVAVSGEETVVTDAMFGEDP